MQKNTLPFSDLTGQKSPAILKIISVVKRPLLRIYYVGVANECRHYKHMVRFSEAILLNEEGSPITFLFDRAKTEKTIEDFKSSRPSPDQQKKVTRAWSEGLAALEKIAFEEDRDHYEKFIFWLIFDIFKKFATGSANIDCFHREKEEMITVFNYVTADKLEIVKPATKAARKRYLKMVGLPVVHA